MQDQEILQTHHYHLHAQNKNVFINVSQTDIFMRAKNWHLRLLARQVSENLMGVKGSKLRKWGGGRSFYKRLEGSVLAPSGYVPICVGMNEDSSRRFMVRTRALADADFYELLVRSAEEYGFRNDGVLRIPFEAQAFEEWMIRRSNQKIRRVKPV